MPASPQDETRLAQWRAHAAAIYDDSFIARLIDDHRISQSVTPELVRELLREAAVNYLSDKSDFETPQTLNARQRKIEEIFRLAGNLEFKINSLNQLDAELFWQPQRNGQFGILAVAQDKPADLDQPKLSLEELNALIDPNRISEQAFIELPEVIRSPYGHEIRTIQIGDGQAVLWLKEPQILEALTILQNLARHAVARIGHVKGRGGAPARHALHNWIASMENVWTAHLGRRFTYSHKDGGSPAFHFCADVIAPLDAEVASPALATAMRGAIRLVRKVERARAAGSIGKNPAS